MTRRKNPSEDPVYLGVWPDESPPTNGVPLDSTVVVWRPRYKRYEVWVLQMDIQIGGRGSRRMTWQYVDQTTSKTEAAAEARDLAGLSGNPLLPLPGDYFPKAAAVRDGLKKVRQEIYEKTEQWLTLDEVQDLLHRTEISYRRKQMRVIPGGKRRANPTRPAGKVVRVKVLLRRTYPQGEDISGDIDSTYHSELDRVLDAVEPKIPAKVPSYEITRIEAVRAKHDPWDFADNTEYTLDVTVKYEW